MELVLRSHCYAEYTPPLQTQNTSVDGRILSLVLCVLKLVTYLQTIIVVSLFVLLVRHC